MQAMKTSMQIVLAFAMVAGCFHVDATLSQQHIKVGVLDVARSAKVPPSAKATSNGAGSQISLMAGRRYVPEALPPGAPALLPGSTGTLDSPLSGVGTQLARQTPQAPQPLDAKSGAATVDNADILAASKALDAKNGAATVANGNVLAASKALDAKNAAARSANADVIAASKDIDAKNGAARFANADVLAASKVLDAKTRAAAVASAGVLAASKVLEAKNGAATVANAGALAASKAVDAKKVSADMSYYDRSKSSIVADAGALAAMNSVASLVQLKTEQSPDGLMVAQDPMANHALEGRMQTQMEPQTPAAIKAAQFRRLRNELRAQRRKKEEVKTKLMRLQDLQRQHLLAKAKIDKHEPKVASRAAKSYLDAALTKLANDMADSRRQLRVIDRAVSDLKIEKAKTVARQVQITRLDAALVVKIQEDQAEVANLDELKKQEDELKRAVDAHRGVATAELQSKVANGRELQGGLEAQLVNTLANKTFLANKVFGATYTEDVGKLDIGTKSVATVSAAISEIKDVTDTDGSLPRPIQAVIDVIPASTQTVIDALPASAALREAGRLPGQLPPREVQLSEVEQREELEEAELAHAEVEDYSEKAMHPTSALPSFLEVKK